MGDESESAGAAEIETDGEGVVGPAWHGLTRVASSCGTGAPTLTGPTRGARRVAPGMYESLSFDHDGM